jgi:MipA family protein
LRALFPAVAALLATLSAAPAAAQDASPPPDVQPVEESIGGDSLTIGVAGAYLPEYEGSEDYQFTPAPGAIGSYKGFSFQLAGNRLSADLIPNRPGPTWDFQLGPLAVVNFNRNSVDNIDNPAVRALGELDTAIELGGYVGIGKTGVITSPYDRLSVTLSYRTDVNGVHRSDIWQPSVNYLTPLSRKAAVALFASAEHAGDGYARTYFGVDPAGAVRSGLPVYDPEGGWKNWTFGLLGTYALTGDLLKGFKVVAGGTYRRMLNDFGDSPITTSRSQWLGAVGLAYTF